MRRAACFVLALLLAVLPGCVPAGGENAAGPQSAFDTHLEISVGYWDLEAMLGSNVDDPMLETIEKRFNITLRPMSVSWSDYLERYRVLSVTQSLPDMFATLSLTGENKDVSSLQSMIDNGAIRALPQDLSAWPLISQTYDLVDYLDEEFRRYCFPRVSFRDPVLASSDAAMLVRKDWMQALGLDEPQSLEEFIRLAAAFAHDDPDGNGLDDTVGYNVNVREVLGKWLVLGIAPDCNVFGWVQRDGGYTHSSLTEEYREEVLAYRRLYQTGGLDPDFYTQKSGDAVDDFARGKLGLLEYKSSPSSIVGVMDQWSLHQDTPFEEAVGVLNIFPAADGVRYANSSNIFWSETLFSSSVDDEKMERILHLMEYLLSDEGQMLVKFGLEGVDYRLEEGGYSSLVTVEPGQSQNSQLDAKYPSRALFSSLVSWGGTEDDFEPMELNYLRYGQYPVDMAWQALQWNTENAVQVQREYAFIMMPKEDFAGLSSQDMADVLAQVIIGQDDPLDMWDALLEEYHDRGLKAYIEDLNRQYEGLAQ